MTPRPYYQLLRNWGIAITQLFPRPGLFYLPRYLVDWRKYRQSGTEAGFVDSFPCLTDRVARTPFDPHYFYQAAWLARRLAAARPARHVDIGSDIRMINVLSAFVDTEFVDFRPLPVTLSRLACSAGNITALPHASGSIQSLSSLHVVEHIGLGRYGDPIDPKGNTKALLELNRVLSQGGRLYLSVPVGRERVCFNAHRVFHPQTIVACLRGLRLVEFSLVDDSGAYHEFASQDVAVNLDYGCGLFLFENP